MSAISRRNRIKSLIRQKQNLEIQLKKLEALNKVSSGKFNQNEYSKLGKKDFDHLLKIIDSLETKINQLNHQFQYILKLKQELLTTTTII